MYHEIRLFRFKFRHSSIPMMALRKMWAGDPIDTERTNSKCRVYSLHLSSFSSTRTHSYMTTVIGTIISQKCKHLQMESFPCCIEPLDKLGCCCRCCQEPGTQFFHAPGRQSRQCAFQLQSGMLKADIDHSQIQHRVCQSFSGAISL